MLKRITFALLFTCVWLASAVAQEIPNASVQNVSVTITAAAHGERVRITGPASVVQLHVEVYDFSGVKLFDQEIRGGNVLDWHSQNGQGRRLAPGDYVCVVTAKSVSGRITQKIGSVTIGEQEARVALANGAQLSPAQAQTIGPVEENSSWTVSGTDEPLTPTVIAHDGTDGQMIRGRGALTFRIGNFFTGNDREQMRLTEDGRLGLGTSDPRATLDVAGTIRAQRFLIVKPKSADAGKSAQDYLTTNASEPEEFLLTGTGTTNRVAKWLDNAGTLGDSAITETGGNVGIGTTTPGSRLVVSSNSAPLPPATGIARFADADGVQTGVFADSFGTNPIFNVRRANGTAASPSALQANQIIGVIGASGYGASAYVGTRARVAFVASENWTNTANGTYLTFNTTANGASTAGGIERMRIDNNGNVGIGTTNPQARLHVSQAGQAAYFDGNVTFFSNVGINTSTPADRLDVRGNIRFGIFGELRAVGSDENLRIIRGTVAANGSIIAGSGFTVSNPSTGVYNITFTRPFVGSNPTITATPELTSDLPIIMTDGSDVSGLTLKIFRRSDGAASAEAFHFIAVGPR